MNVDLRPGSVRIREERALVPLRGRVNRWRPEAMAIAKEINPNQFERKKNARGPLGTGVFTRDE
jgi:hypothetical protein